ncbi:hypothetical protein GWO43_23525 [candidate division KSB1 bacterium]|nr:hypothetical protein [candidate division KSB1 bacterium]NIR73179.1 hypothetical protein [candidate division KSB1 bacterium]NIS26949.1 hypothetical protein [candidate division KSB1 bacterium]NIT73787.1 hypothetical protein [candidate division KSB1 bacterium]NIU27693.1 hypothetical protein [candidate division KSB1 bacterium]
MRIVTSQLLQICLTLSLAIGFEAHAQELSRIQKKIDSLHTEIEEIRGLEFKQQVNVTNQSPEDFGKYLDKMLEMQIPDRLEKNYGKIVKKLGLYLGPEIENFKQMAKMIMQSQAAAYYDPASEAFYVVMEDLPEQMLDAVYVHELYHGLQDQHYDLETYVLAKFENGLNDDQLLARQAVVEGEATYIMTLWSMKNMMGQIPGTSMLEVVIKMQAQLDVLRILEMLKSGPISQANTTSMKQAIAAMDSIPPFLLETLVGAYLKGMAFVFEIQKQSWNKVGDLYAQPPISTEQILHPQKWLSKEEPVKLSWPNFAKEGMFSDWKLLEENTIGEIQWQIIFAEHEMAEQGRKAAAGWNGDIFAVLENKGDGDLLLLIYSSWDSETDATEFHSAYQELLEVKYAAHEENVIIERRNNDVLIIEGGEKDQIDPLFSFMMKARKESAKE